MPRQLSVEECEEYGEEGPQSNPSDGDNQSGGVDSKKSWKEYPWSIDLPICLAPKPTNPGSRDHPNCRPCAFVFRLAGDCVRLRCANAETCEFCHDPSHPRYRGRHSRRKSRRMRTDRQLQDAMDQEEPADESASYDDSASHTRTSSNG